MHWPVSRSRSEACRFVAFLAIMLVQGTVFFVPLPRAAQPRGDQPAQEPKAPPVPAPFIQREEVRFVTLDLVVEEHGGAAGRGWHPARSLTQEQIHVLVGGEEMTLDLFENWCSEGPPGRSHGRAPTSASAATLPAPATSGTADRAQAGDAGSPGPAAGGDTPSRGSGLAGFPDGPEEQQDSSGSAARKYVLYFDLQHLTTSGRESAFKAALAWGNKVSRSSDEVMILMGGLSLRVVRPMLPASRHLLEDLRAAHDDFDVMDLWAEGEERRIEEIKDGGGKALARLYASIDYDIARRSLENLNRMMVIFGSISGTKDLVYFSETLRLYPGSEYPFGPSPEDASAQDVAKRIYGLAAQANERNVRIYGVQASGLNIGKDIEEPLVVLSEETGGRHVQQTNDLGTVFSRVEEDYSCFYRVGFRMPTVHSGKLKTILVRIGPYGRGYRVRYRRSVEDPTREKVEQDRLTEAFLNPTSAQAFPVDLTLTRLFDFSGGSRVRIEVALPVDSLLALPHGDSRQLQMTVRFGGQVVPLRAGFAPAGRQDKNAWADVDPRRETFSFDRQAEIHLPPSRAASHRPSRIVYTGEIEVPPGDFRVVVAVQDARTGVLSTRLADLHAEASGAPLGEIGIATEDPAAVLVPAPEVAEEAGRSGRKNRREIRPADHPLPAKLLLARTGPLNAGRRTSFYYALCLPTPSAADDHLPVSNPEALKGWEIRRKVVCGKESGRLLPSIESPHISSATGCALVVDSLPAGWLKSGSCRFEVRLDRPGTGPIVHTREFLAEDGSHSPPSTASTP